jgi:hypothetical protein
MTRLEIILSASLLLSVILNVGVTLYARATILRLLSISEELGDLQDMINSFTTHLDDVYSLEMFYGDQTLANLLDHASSFNEQMQTFEYIYTLTMTDAVDDEASDPGEPIEEENIDDDGTQTT